MTKDQQIYLYLIRATRPGFLTEATPEEEEIMRRHFEYLKRLLQEGILIMAGPCLDRALGIAIYRAENDAAARLIAQEDPSVKAGIMSVEVHPYRISLGQNFVSPHKP
jgi:uncharacterized protein